MPKTRISSALLSGASLAAFLSFMPAHAADGDKDPKSSLEEITVTAQKREQSAQDVPISINAFSGNFLETIAAEDLRDLNAYAPGLEVDGVTQPKFKIRGVETNDFGVGTDPAVGVFIDGVYASRSGAAILFFSDIDRVEVLKGPQGTLFGRNTAAGAISVVTKKPDMDDFAARLNLRYGRFDKQQVDAMLNLPLTDTVAMRANLLVNDQDGYAKDAITGDDYGRQHNVTGRVQFRWEPSERTALNFTYEFDHTAQDEARPVVGVSDGSLRAPLGAETVGDLPGHGDWLEAVAPLFGLPITKDTPLDVLYGIPLGAIYAGFGAFGYTPSNPSADWNFFRDGNSIGGADPFGPFSSDVRNGEENRNLDGFNLTITHDFDWGTLTSISAYKYFSTNNLEEEDGTADINFYFDSDNIEKNDHFYQEVRLNGTSGKLTWTAGASYYWEKAKQTTATHATLDAIDTVLYNIGVTPGVLASTFNPLDGINACESLFLDSLGGFISFNNTPLGCFSPAFAGTPLESLSLEAVSNLAYTSMSGRLWTESMYGEGTTKAFAAFADATYAVTDRMNITAGMRYTHDKKSWLWLNGLRTVEDQGLDVPGVGNLADIQQQLLTGIFQAFLGPTSSGDIVFNNGALEGVSYEDTRSWDNFSPRVTVDYKVSEDAMVFASYTRGYKAGGYNSLEIASNFKPEKVWSIEAGMKSQWLDNTVRFNISGWKYAYDNKQSISLVEESNSSIPKYQTQNQDVEGKGVDVELLWAPVAGLRLFANGTYQDITCVNECGKSAEGEPTGAPTTQISFGGDYTFALKDLGGTINIHADHSYTSAQRTNGQCLQEGTCGTIVWGTGSWETGVARNYTNARVGWVSEDEKYGLSVFVRNLFGNRYRGGASGITAETLGTPISELETPSTWGVDLTMNF